MDLSHRSITRGFTMKRPKTRKHRQPPAVPISEWKPFSIAGSTTDSAVTSSAMTTTATATAAMARTQAPPEPAREGRLQAGGVTTIGGRGPMLTSSLKTSGRP